MSYTTDGNNVPNFEAKCPDGKPATGANCFINLDVYQTPRTNFFTEDTIAQNQNGRKMQIS